MQKRLLIACPVLLFAASAWGSSCSTSTLSTYIASGFSCTEGDLLFSNFSYFSGTAPAASAVTVTPVDNASGIGFYFQGTFQSLNAASSDAILGYQISTLDAAAILTGNTVSLLNDTATGGGNVQIVEGICTKALSGAGACPAKSSYSTSASYNVGPPVSGSATGSVVFAAPASMEVVSKNIITNGASGSASISYFENTVQVTGGGAGQGGGPVPEPGSTVTIGSGLILTSLLLRKRFR